MPKYIVQRGELVRLGTQFDDSHSEPGSTKPAVRLHGRTDGRRRHAGGQRHGGSQHVESAAVVGTQSRPLRERDGGQCRRRRWRQRVQNGGDAPVAQRRPGADGRPVSDAHGPKLRSVSIILPPIFNINYLCVGDFGDQCELFVSDAH